MDFVDKCEHMLTPTDKEKVAEVFHIFSLLQSGTYASARKSQNLENTSTKQEDSVKNLSFILSKFASGSKSPLKQRTLDTWVVKDKSPTVKDDNSLASTSKTAEPESNSPESNVVVRNNELKTSVTSISKCRAEEASGSDSISQNSGTSNVTKRQKNIDFSDVSFDDVQSIESNKRLKIVVERTDYDSYISSLNSAKKEATPSTENSEISNAIKNQNEKPTKIIQIKQNPSNEQSSLPACCYNLRSSTTTSSEKSTIHEGSGVVEKENSRVEMRDLIHHVTGEKAFSVHNETVSKLKKNKKSYTRKDISCDKKNELNPSINLGSHINVQNSSLEDIAPSNGDTSNDNLHSSLEYQKLPSNTLTQDCGDVLDSNALTLGEKDASLKKDVLPHAVQRKKQRRVSSAKNVTTNQEKSLMTSPKLVSEISDQEIVSLNDLNLSRNDSPSKMAENKSCNSSLKCGEDAVMSKTPDAETSDCVRRANPKKTSNFVKGIAHASQFKPDNQQEKKNSDPVGRKGAPSEVNISTSKEMPQVKEGISVISFGLKDNDKHIQDVPVNSDQDSLKCTQNLLVADDQVRMASEPSTSLSVPKRKPRKRSGASREIPNTNCVTSREISEKISPSVDVTNCQDVASSLKSKDSHERIPSISSLKEDSTLNSKGKNYKLSNPQSESLAVPKRKGKRLTPQKEYVKVVDENDILNRESPVSSHKNVDINGEHENSLVDAAAVAQKIGNKESKIRTRSVSAESDKQIKTREKQNSTIKKNAGNRKLNLKNNSQSTLGVGCVDSLFSEAMIEPVAGNKESGNEILTQKHTSERDMKNKLSSNFISNTKQKSRPQKFVRAVDKCYKGLSSNNTRSRQQVVSPSSMNSESFVKPAKIENIYKNILGNINLTNNSTLGDTDAVTSESSLDQTEKVHRKEKVQIPTASDFDHKNDLDPILREGESKLGSNELELISATSTEIVSQEILTYSTAQETNNGVILENVNSQTAFYSDNPVPQDSQAHVSEQEELTPKKLVAISASSSNSVPNENDSACSFDLDENSPMFASDSQNCYEAYMKMKKIIYENLGADLDTLLQNEALQKQIMTVPADGLFLIRNKISHTEKFTPEVSVNKSKKKLRDILLNKLNNKVLFS